MDAHRVYATVLESMAQYRLAIEQYLKASEINPNLTFLYAYIGRNYLRLRVYDRALEYFAKLVKDKSKGNLDLKVYPSQQLGNAMKMMEGVSMGSQDMVAESTTFWEIYAKTCRLRRRPTPFETVIILRNS